VRRTEESDSNGFRESGNPARAGLIIALRKSEFDGFRLFLLAASDSEVLLLSVNRNIFYVIGVIVVIVIILKVLGLF
jgi:hypothetical protein